MQTLSAGSVGRFVCLSFAFPQMPLGSVSSSLQWEKLQMTASERRKIMCSVTFHVIAITCVVWSLYVLIDRTADEIRQGQRAPHSHLIFICGCRVGCSVRPSRQDLHPSAIHSHVHLHHRRVTIQCEKPARFCPAKIGERVGAPHSQRPRPASKRAAECAWRPSEMGFFFTSRRVFTLSGHIGSL